MSENNAQLSAEVISVATQLEGLNETLKKGVVDSALQKKYEEVMAKTKALVDKLPAGQEQHLTDEATVRLHNLQEALKTTEADLAKLEKEVGEKGGGKNNREKAKDMIDKYKTPVALAGAAVTGGYGLFTGFGEGWKEGKGIGKPFNALRKGLKGFFKGAWARGAARLGATAVSMGIDKFADLSKLNPFTRGKNAVIGLGASVAGLLTKITGNKSEIYDPGNQETEAARLEDGVLEMRFDELNRPVLASDSKKTSDVVALPEEIRLKPEEQQAVLDDRFKDPTFTDKYMLTVSTANIWAQAARKRIPSTMNPLNDDGGDYNSLWLIEQDILAVQKLVLEPTTDKAKLSSATTALLDKISTFENDRTNVIGGGDRKKLMGNIQGHTAGSDNARETNYTATQVKVLDHMRKLGGYGDSDVVAHALMDDLFSQERYAPVLKLFEDVSFLEEVEKAALAGSDDFDAGLNARLMKFFGQHNLLANGTTKGLSPEAVALLAKELIKQHKAIKARFDEKTPQNGLEQIGKHFLRTYGDINTDTKAQERMVQAYEKQFGAPALAEYAKNKKGIADYATNKFTIIKDFAWDMAKEQAYKSSLINGFGSLFFDHFLGATAKKQATVGGGTLQSFADPKEGLLADVIGAGSDFSDATTNIWIDIGINVALSLIPMVGTNMIVARVASSIAGATMKASLARLGVSVAVGGVVGHVAHTTMNALIGNNKGGSFSETIKNYFGSLLDRKEFAKNTLFYGLLTGLGPFLKTLNVAQLSKATRMSPELLTKLGSGFGGKFLINSGIAGAETGVMEGAKLAFDPDYERSRGDVVTTFMLALAMNSMQKAAVGKEKEIPALQATKGKDGKVTLKLGKHQLKPLNKLAHQIDAKGDVATTLAKHIEHGTIFTSGANKIKLSQDGGVVSVMRQTAKGREKLDAAGISKLVASKHELIIQNITQKLMGKLGNSPQSMKTTLEKAKINSGDFMERCRTHQVGFIEKHTVGDFFKLIGEKRFGKLLLGNRKSAPNETIAALEGWKMKALRNSHMAVNLGSLVYGMTAGDGDEAGGIDEGLENYLLYGVINRTIPGKIIMAMIDSSDIIM